MFHWHHDPKANTDGTLPIVANNYGGVKSDDGFLLRCSLNPLNSHTQIAAIIKLHVCTCILDNQ